MDRRIILSLLLLGLMCLMASSPIVDAQESATIQAIAIVMPSLTVTGTNDLNFEEVVQGTPKYVDKSSSGFAGEWHITGTESADVNLEFTVPDSLRIPGISSMEVRFGSTDASYDNGSGEGQSAPAGIFDPNINCTRNMGNEGNMTVWLGGTVVPEDRQANGIYSADITLTVTYVED